MNVLEQLKEIAGELLKPVVKPFAMKVATLILFPILEEQVKKTSTPIDDIVLASVKTSVLKAIEDLTV